MISWDFPCITLPFTNLFLADEINRTSPKTQSALLEVMEEKTATVDGVTRPLPDPFVVIATENPYGSSGTQLLPDYETYRAQVDNQQRAERQQRAKETAQKSP